MSFIGDLISGLGSLAGGFINQDTQESINNQNLAMQQEMATSGIQMRVADAKAAGINPLAALGYNAPSVSNVVGSDALGNGVAAAGQALGRAVQSTSTPDDRAYNDAKQAQDLQHGELENQLLASQIRTVNQPANGPPTPALNQKYVVDGQGSAVVGGSSNAVSVVPDKVTASDPVGATTMGAHPDVSLVKTAGGGYAPYPSKDFQGASFGSNLAAAGWDARNYLAPAFGFNQPDLPPAGRGHVWRFNPVSGSYYQDWSASAAIGADRKTWWQDLKNSF